MQVSKEEILHIANLARLDLNENEVDKYIEMNLEWEVSTPGNI